MYDAAHSLHPPPFCSPQTVHQVTLQRLGKRRKVLGVAPAFQGGVEAVRPESPAGFSAAATVSAVGAQLGGLLGFQSPAGSGGGGASSSPVFQSCILGDAEQGGREAGEGEAGGVSGGVVDKAARLMGLKKFDQAYQLLSQALEGSVEEMGPEHPDTIRLRGSLAQCAMGTERLVASEDSVGQRQAVLPLSPSLSLSHTHCVCACFWIHV